ncbi:MAG: hypothetical protein MUP09_04575, partial [Thiovulaceae bacterium]|nr:hypothetical protein [Sulfurimonadaceae bacterium]
SLALFFQMGAGPLHIVSDITRLADDLLGYGVADGRVSCNTNIFGEMGDLVGQGNSTLTYLPLFCLNLPPYKAKRRIKTRSMSSKRSVAILF